ncbi:MAG: hypothetical protein ACFCU6_09260 [Balneolaceae bacterium]
MKRTHIEHKKYRAKGIEPGVKPGHGIAMRCALCCLRFYFRGQGGAVLSLLLLLTIPTQGMAQSLTKTDTLAAAQAVPEQYEDLRETLRQVADSTQIVLHPDRLPETAFLPITNLNVRDMDVRDLLRGLGREYNLNIIADNGLNTKATVRLSGLPVIEALVHICLEHSLRLIQSGQVLRISRYIPPETVKKPEIPDISFRDSLMTLDLMSDELDLVVRRISELTGKNIVIRNGVSGRLTGFLQNISFRPGLETILRNNGFSLRERDGILLVDRGGRSLSDEGGGSGPSFWVNVSEGLISMDVTNARIPDLINEIALQTDVNLVTYNLPDGTLSARTVDLGLEQTFAYLFRGTNVTYRKEGNIYVIGDKNTSGIATNKLIRLNHLRADVAMELIPESILIGASVQIVKEQNGLLVIGTNDIILELESFIREIDYPTPQILIEALVVDLKSTDLFELGTTLGYKVKPDEGFELGEFGTFGTLDSGGSPTGGLTLQGDGETVNRLFAVDGDLFGIKNLGVLPSDFYFRIQALSQEGIMNIRSRPQIATLNGHTASIEIGTTQYFILRSTTPLRSPQDVVVQESERFETIEANVSLKITPWVSASGEVTAEIQPQFNTPVGSFSPDVPPTINSRVLDSTVRLKDGETIILGGLIQDSDVRSYNKIPILGDIPLLGKLFSNRSTSTVKSELVIFITPHVFYGDEADSRRWKKLRDDLDIDIE